VLPAESQSDAAAMPDLRPPSSPNTGKWLFIVFILVVVLVAGGIALAVLLRDRNGASGAFASNPSSTHPGFFPSIFASRCLGDTFFSCKLSPTRLTAK